MSDSASAKIAIVVGIGAVALGMVAIRNHFVKPSVTGRSGTAQAAQQEQFGEHVAPVANGRSPAEPSNGDGQPPKTTGPTKADRVVLREACASGDQGRVEALFAKGVSLDGTLGDAAASGNASLVGWLLAHGVDVKEDADLAVPPILAADDHDAVVALLLARGAHEPTLAKAVAVAAPKAVTRLLGKGASASSKSSDGEPVLLIAVRDADGAKRRVIVDALLKAGADPNTNFDDETPLSLALANVTAGRADDSQKPGDRAIDTLSRLVAKGAKVDGDMLVSAMNLDEERRGPLLDALLTGTLERNATLLGAGHAADMHDVASLKKLAAKGIAWSALEANEMPPLENAIVAADVPMVKALLEAGAPTERMGENGDTALLAAVAAAAGDSDDAVRVVRVLLEHGASPNKRGRDGRTALFAAAQQGSEGLVTLLVARGARVDDAVDGMTPLEAADARGNDGVVKLLKARGARRKAPARAD